MACWRMSAARYCKRFFDLKDKKERMFRSFYIVKMTVAKKNGVTKRAKMYLLYCKKLRYNIYNRKILVFFGDMYEKEEK